MEKSEVAKVFANNATELALQYSARLQALEIQRETLNQLFVFLQWGVGAIGGLVVLFAGVFLWMNAKNWNELKEDLQGRVSSLLDAELVKQSKTATSIHDMHQDYQKLMADLEQAKNQLKGYVDVINGMNSMAGFDPLEQYAALDKEIDARESIESEGGKTEGTLAEPAFRQRAAAVFASLLEEVRRGQQEGKPKIDVVTLFNAAANAAKMDLDFVALELMEASVEQDKSKNPEYLARLIRQRLNMSRISSQEALDALAQLLPGATGFSLHHVVSEAFNIGLHSTQPGAVAQILADKLPAPLAGTSYALFVRARLLKLNSTEKDAQESKILKQAGIEKLNQEDPQARWFASSLRDARRLGIDVTEARKRHLEATENT